MDRRAPRTGADVASPNVVQEQGAPISIAVFDSALTHYLLSCSLFLSLTRDTGTVACQTLDDCRPCSIA